MDHHHGNCPCLLPCVAIVEVVANRFAIRVLMIHDTGWVVPMYTH